METIGTLSIYIVLEMPGAAEARPKLVYTERGINAEQAEAAYDAFKRKNIHVQTFGKFTPAPVWF